MKTRKNFWAASVLAVGWMALFVFLELMRYTNIFGILAIVGPFVAFLVTYQLLRIVQYIPDTLEKQQTPRRAQRHVDDVLRGLNDEELDALRLRLSDLDDDMDHSLESLLVEERGKRKNY